MKKCIHYFLVTLILGIMHSCGNDVFEEKTSVEYDNSAFVVGVVKFKYEGEIYTSEYEKNINGIIYRNKNVGLLIDQLKENTELFTLIHDDGLVEFFDSYFPMDGREIANFNSSVFEDNTETRSLVAFAELTLYTRKNFSGDKYRAQVHDKVGLYGWACPNLHEINMGNKVTSMKLKCYGPDNILGPLDAKRCRVVFFKNYNWQGPAYGFELVYPNVTLEIRDLVNYSYTSAPLLPDPLDDQMLSLVLELGR